MDDSAYNNLGGQHTSYKEFDLDLNPQKDNTLESKADEDVVYISLDPDKPECKAKIGSKLTNHKKELFTNFIHDNKDVLTWSKKDMPGIDHSAICYPLHLDLTARLIIQRKRNHRTKQSKIIVEVHHLD